MRAEHQEYKFYKEQIIGNVIFTRTEQCNCEFYESWVYEGEFKS